MNGETLLLNKSEVFDAWSGEIDSAVDVVERAFIDYHNGLVILPEKASMVFDQSTQDRINCMPSAVGSLNRAGVKWVSVFPDNPSLRGLPNVGGVMVVSEMETGGVVSIMDAASLTAIRTAAVDALAARYLAPSSVRSIGILGTGEQAFNHARFLAPAESGVTVRVAGRTPKHAESLALRLVDEGIKAESFGDDMCGAVRGADVIVTAISGQYPLLKADWITGGPLYCHVGGWEDEFAVAKKADRIVCDNWNALKHRGSPTIARMYESGQLFDEDIYSDLADIVSGNKSGRSSDGEFIYFNAIGLSFVDVALAAWLSARAKDKGLGTTFNFGL